MLEFFLDVKQHKKLAAAAFYHSTSTNSAILVIDDTDSDVTVTIWKAEKKKIKLLYRLKNPFNLTKFTEAIAERTRIPLPDRLQEAGAKEQPFSMITRDFLHEFFSFDSFPAKFKYDYRQGFLEWRKASVHPYKIAGAYKEIYGILCEQLLLKTLDITQSRNLCLIGNGITNQGKELAKRYFDYTYVYEENDAVHIGEELLQTRKHLNIH